MFLGPLENSKAAQFKPKASNPVIVAGDGTPAKGTLSLESNLRDEEVGGLDKASSVVSCVLIIEINYLFIDRKLTYYINDEKETFGCVVIFTPCSSKACFWRIVSHVKTGAPPQDKESLTLNVISIWFLWNHSFLHNELLNFGNNLGDLSFQFCVPSPIGLAFLLFNHQSQLVFFVSNQGQQFLPLVHNSNFVSMVETCLTKFWIVHAPEFSCVEPLFILRFSLLLYNFLDIHELSRGKMPSKVVHIHLGDLVVEFLVRSLPFLLLMSNFPIHFSFSISISTFRLFTQLFLVVLAIS